MKTRIFLFVLCLLAALSCLPAAAQSPEKPVTVMDPADLLSESDESAIANALSDPAAKVRYFIVTGTEVNYPSDWTVLNTCALTEQDSAVILWVRQRGTTYYYDIYTFGKADRYFSRSAVDRILDDDAVYDNIKAGRLAAGCTSFLQLADRHVSRRPLRALAIGVIFGGIAGGAAVLIVVMLYRKKQHGESYPLDRYAKLRLTERQDLFVGSFVTRTRIQSNSGGGRSGGGGGHHSGGGHRGGR